VGKHHTKYQAWYGKEGREDVTHDFKRRKNDYRLMVSAEEKHEMIRVAIGLSGQCDQEFGVDFWLDVGPKLRSPTGVVTPSKNIVSRSVDHLDVDFDTGFVSQDVYLTQDAGIDDESDEEVIGASLQDRILHTENLYDLLKSATNVISDRNRLLANPRIEAGIRERVGDLLAWINEETLKLHAKEDAFEGDIVSCNLPLDKRKVAVRLKRRSEHTSKRTRSVVSRKTLLSIDSLM
jgi:hypothetical protein